MIDIHYTIQNRHHLPEELDWLTPGERARLEGFRFEKRRRDWLLGRWAAKSALLRVAGMTYREARRFEIASADDGAPLPWLDGRSYNASLSLSHSHNRALAAAVWGTRVLGCDIELVETRSARFVETYFTAAECEQVSRAHPRSRDLLITLIWSAKESTLKALRTGLRADTRSVEVMIGADYEGTSWKTARIAAADRREFSCVWRRDGQFVISLVTRDPAASPLRVCAELLAA